MGIFTYKPQNVVQVDDKAGNAYTIFSVDHIVEVAASNDIAVELDPSVISCIHIPSAGQTAVTVTLDAAPAEFPASGQSRGWTKTASFPAESATGTYTLVARHAGSAASVGSSNLDY